MSNQSIREYLSFYTQHRGKLEYAVLLDGEWGAGKTYFIKNYIKDNDPKIFLYVSLYGLKEVSEIEDRFLQLTFPKLHSPTLNILSNTMGMFEYNGLSINTAKIEKKDFLKRKKNCIIVFDDLERSNIHINTTLGFINHLVEHEGSRVIIIAHEEKIIPLNNENDDRTKYLEIKEKLIGRTFAISAELEPALLSFINCVPDLKVKNILEENIQNIIYTYNAIGYQNLRSLRQVIDEFSRLYGLLPAIAKSKKDLMSDVISFLMIFLFENRKALLTIEDMQNISASSLHALSKSKKNNEAKPTNREKFFKKYESKNFYEICPSDSCWYEFFKYGTIDAEKLEVSIQNSRFFKDENAKEWVKLWHFRDLEEEHFTELLNKVKENFEKYEYRQPGILKHVAGLLIHFSKEKIIDSNIETVVEYIKKIFKDLNDKELLFLEGKKFGRFEDAFAGLGFFSAETSEFLDVAGVLDSYVKEASERRLPAIAAQLLSFLNSDPQQFWDALSPYKTSGLRLYNVPIFKFINPEIFVKDYLRSANHHKDVIAYAFKDRYEQVSSYPALCEELECITLIDKRLEEAQSTSKPIMKYRIRNFREHTLKQALVNLREKSEKMSNLLNS